MKQKILLLVAAVLILSCTSTGVSAVEPAYSDVDDITKFEAIKTNETIVIPGVESKVKELQELYPNGSYFTANGAPCSHGTRGTCNNCRLSSIIDSNYPEINKTNLTNSWTCLAFARFTFYQIFGINWQSCSSEVKSIPLKDAKIGDFVCLGHHYGIFIKEKNDKVYLYEANTVGTTEVSYCKVDYSKSEIVAIYRANNYDEINENFKTSKTVTVEVTAEDILGDRVLSEKQCVMMKPNDAIEYGIKSFFQATLENN